MIDEASAVAPAPVIRVSPLRRGLQFLLRRYIRFVLDAFYGRVQVVGAENVPRAGPLVIIANHNNGVMDWALLLGRFPRHFSTLAKAAIFKNPILGPICWVQNSIPVYRKEDLPPGMQRDPMATISAALAHLRGGGSILMFPEGVSQPEPRLEPLKTGMARMVFAADGAGGGHLGLHVVPVGFVYRRPGTFRGGWALITIGKPLSMADPIARFATDPEGAVRALTADAATALRRLMLEAHDRETQELLHLADAVWRDGTQDDPATKTAWMRRMLRA